MSVRALRLTRHLLTGVVVLLAIILTAMLIPRLERQMDRWGLLPRHESMTELYVSDVKKVPTTYKSDTAQDIDFSVHNLKKTTTSYDYTIAATSENKKVSLVLTKGTISLNPNQTAVIHKQITLSDMGERVHVQVKLSSGQTIGYWEVRE